MKASNHLLILIKIEGKEETFHKPFHFLQAWTTDSSSFKVVKEAWTRDAMQDSESYKLKNTTRALKEWNKKCFGFTHSKIKALEEKLRVAQRNGDNGNENENEEFGL